jgi:PPOX class probable FMN-dependent enzyme
MDGDTIGSKAELRERYGAPSERSLLKEMTRLDAHCRNFIAQSPFLVIATTGSDGLGDCSPRGDAPGFVAVLDDTTIVIPDRLGNNRTDSLRNIIDNPGIGLLFLLPGVNETLRVNGLARITTDAALLAPLAAQGKAPRSGLLVEVKQAYLQCGKALIRSKLWDKATQIERASFPSLGKILADQIGLPDVAASERMTEEGYKNRLY